MTGLRSDRLFTSPLLTRFCPGLLALLVTGAASAQAPLERPTTLPALGRTLVGNGDSTAITQNPANLAFLPGPELRWSGYFLGDSAQTPTQGHAFGFALPLGFIPVSTGLRVDLVTPNSLTGRQMYGAPFSYQWLTWAVALGGEAASIGFAFERSYSDIPEVHGFGTWSTGVNLRPFDHFGLAGVIHQVDAPTSQSGLRLGTTYEMGVELRPTGTDALAIGVEAQYIDERGGYWVPRAVADVAVPGLGRVRGDVSWRDPGGQVGDPSWVASTSLVIAGNARQGSAEGSLGARYGSGLGSGASERVYENLHAELAIRGFRETAATDNLGYGLRIRLEETPSPRQHVRLLRRLWQMAEDEKNLKAVLLEVRATPAESLAHIQELQDALFYLREKGKKVLCHVEDGGGAALYLCSAADRILLNPAGGIHYSGLKSQSFYLKDLLGKLGVRADFVRIGKHKSAPEVFSRSEGSETSIDDRADLLQQIELEMSSSIASGRKLSIEELRSTIDKGPFTAAEAKKGQLVDGFAFDDMLEQKVDELVGEPVLMEDGPFGPSRSNHYGPRQRVAIIYVDGDMVDGHSQTFPFIGIKTAGSYTIAESLKSVREDPSVGAVVLRVETGGGSAMAADVIWREVQLTAAKKPLVVSMGAAAASGGYYISAPSNYVYANPLSITGSIGIFYGKIDVAELLTKIGVNVETLRTSDRADAEGIFRPFTDEEREVLKRKIEQFYGLFLQRVADGRHLTPTEVDAVGRGRVWTGRQAKAHGLVDELGGLRQALAKARVLGGVRDDAPILELPVPQSSLIGKLLGVEGLKSELGATPPPLPPQLLDMVRAVAPYAIYRSDRPLARIEALPNLVP